MDVEKYPAGLRVLAVDDDRSGLLLLKKLLNLCNYNNVTTVTDATTAWDMLRERKGRDDQFHLVISDIFMVDGGIDGLKLLEYISLEMDIPVILISTNDDMETMIKGIKNGACDYLVKPARIEQIRNIWMHVARKNMNNPKNKVIGDEDGAGQRLQSVDGENIEKDGANHTNKYSKKNKKNGNHAEEDKDRTSTQKKQRMQWSSQLHNKFLEAINRLAWKAVPKKILEVMNVDGLSRECIASHLQKYRIYLKKLNDGMSQPEGSHHQKDLGRNEPSPTFVCGSSSSNPFARMNYPSVFGMHSVLPTQSAQHISSQRNLGIALQQDTQPSINGVNLSNNVVFGNSYASSSRQQVAVSGQVPTFWNEYQNQMAGLMGTTTQMLDFSGQEIVNSGSNSSSILVPTGNSSLGSSSSNIPTLSNLLIGNSFMPNHMSNGGGATGILCEDGTVGQQFTSVGDQVNNNNEIAARTSETQDGPINGLDGFFVDWMFL